MGGAFPLPAHVFVVVGGCGGRRCTISSAELAISRAFERSLKSDQTRLPVPRLRVFRGYKSLYPYPYPRKPMAKPVPFTTRIPHCSITSRKLDWGLREH